MPADWKLGADNFIGDANHTAFCHFSVVGVGILPAPNAESKEQSFPRRRAGKLV